MTPENPLLDLLNHRLAKYIAIAMAVGALFYGAWKRNARLVTAALLSVPALGPMSGQAVAQTTVYAAGDTTSGTW